MWNGSFIGICRFSLNLHEIVDSIPHLAKRKSAQFRGKVEGGNKGGWVREGCATESIEWFIEEKAVVWFGSFTTIPPWSRHRGRLRKRDNFLTGEGGRSWERRQIIRQQESLVLYKLFNTLWVRGKGLTCVAYKAGVSNVKMGSNHTPSAN